MATVNYKWDVQNVQGKPIFKDRYGNIRENVITTYSVVFIGEDDEEHKYQNKYDIIFDITDLANYRPISEVTKEFLLDYAFAKMGEKLKGYIEHSVKVNFGDAEPIVVPFDIK
jgi:hypothetical protein